MIALSPERARDFVLANTRQHVPPHVPEVRLHLADEAHDLWLKTEEELAALGLPPPFWAFAWAGGQGLARFVIDHPASVSGKRVVDFASGSGLVAIAAAQAGAATITTIDTDPFAAQAILLNAEANGVSVDILSGDRIGAPLDADVLLAGDVFYDAAFAARLIPWFDALAAAGLSILVGDPGRAYRPRDRLDALAHYAVPVTRALEDADIKSVEVYAWRAP